MVSTPCSGATSTATGTPPSSSAVGDEALERHHEVSRVEHLERRLADPRHDVVGQIQQDLTDPLGHILFETERLDHVDQRVSGACICRTLSRKSLFASAVFAACTSALLGTIEIRSVL